MPSPGLGTSAPLTRTSPAATATPVSLIALSVESCVVSTVTPPTTTVSVREIGLEVNRGSASATETLECPVRCPTSRLARPLDVSGLAGDTRPTILLSVDDQVNASDWIRFPDASRACACAAFESPTTSVSCETAILSCAANVCGPLGRFSSQLRTTKTAAPTSGMRRRISGSLPKN